MAPASENRDSGLAIVGDLHMWMEKHEEALARLRTPGLTDANHN